MRHVEDPRAMLGRFLEVCVPYLLTLAKPDDVRFIYGTSY